MSMSTTYQVNNIIKYTLSAFNGAINEDSLSNTRKTGEAICKYLILLNRGEVEGQDILAARKSGHDFSPLPINSKIPQFNELLQICKKHKYFSAKQHFNDKTFHRLDDIRFGGNKGSHPPNDINQEPTKEDIDFCLSLLKEVVKWFWNEILVQELPLTITNAFKGQIDDSILNDSVTIEWERLYQTCNAFASNKQKLVLISSPVLDGASEAQLTLLSRVKWSFVLDFNPSSMETGLFKSVENELQDQQIHPITIEQREQKNPLVSNSTFAINWFFANGINSVASTVTTGERNWRLKYADFTKRLISEFTNQKIQNITLVFLWDEIDYIKRIIEVFDDCISNQNLLKIVILYQNDDQKPVLEKQFSTYQASFFNISIAELSEGISRTIIVKSTKSGKKAFQVPARTETGKETFIDIGPKFLSFLDRGIETLYQGIENDSIITEERAFYKGQTINWKELAKEVDVRRNKMDILTSKVKSLLEKTKGGYPIELIHKPGAGGTTLSRRIAFEFHDKYPTILVSKFFRDKTNEAIFQLADLTQKPILAVVDGSQITQNQLMDLVRRTNIDKKHVVFLYVQRSYNEPLREEDKRVQLNDQMLDTIEQARFVERYSTIAQDGSKEIVKLLALKNPSQCEVIDFGLTAYENDFSIDKVESYLLSYLSQVPSNQLKFAGFCALIYYYAQKSTSEYWFSDLFTSGRLSTEVAERPLNERYITKLLFQEFDSTISEETEFWRPRFNRFAKEILQLSLVGLEPSKKSNWQDYLSAWGVSLIRSCRDNNQYLTNDLSDLFKSLFLNRDNEDVLGTDESYETSLTVDRHFSKIIKDIADKDKQLAIFKTLVECYPNEAHFKGHLGRFLYKKAESLIEYEEALIEIESAIELGETDFILWHIKGMCNSDRISFLLRNDWSQYTANELNSFEQSIQEMATDASEDFQKSRELNQHNLHSHTAQIQMMLKVIAFGKEAKKQSSEAFISDKNNKWYESQIEVILELLDEAEYIIDISKDVEGGRFIEKSTTMVAGCQAQLSSLIGNIKAASDKFKSLSETADREMRPYFRKMFVYSTLAGKIGYNFKNYKNGWSKLSDHEFDTLKTALENNIREQPANPNNIKLWLQAVRNSGRYYSLDDCIAVVKQWYDNTKNFELSHFEATYYLYVLYACKSLSTDNSLEKEIANKAKDYLRECTERTNNDRYTFEWFGKGSGVRMMVNHTVLGKMTNEKTFFNADVLQLVEGTIVSMEKGQKGKIKTKSGLDVFFVPSQGNFDLETELLQNVKFFVGFRQTGLVAWQVRRTKEVTPLPISNDTEIEDFDTPTITEEPVKEKPEAKKAEDTVYKLVSEQKPELKILGKMDLEQLEKYSRNKKKKNN